MYESSQDRLAELQAELSRAPSAVALAEADWSRKEPALSKRAQQAVRKVAAHVLGLDTLDGKTREHAKEVLEGLSLSDTHAPTTPCELEELYTKDPPEVAAFFNFWLSESLDELFRDWVKRYTHKEELALLASRSPRVKLGLAPLVAESLPTGLHLGPPERVAGYLFPRRIVLRHTHTPESNSKQFPNEGGPQLRLKETALLEVVEGEDPLKEPLGEVPPFDCELNKDTLRLGFPALAYTPEATLELEDKEKPASNAPNAPTRGEVALAVCNALKMLPPIPRGDKRPYDVFKELVKTCKPKRRKKAQEALDELNRLWTMDYESLPLPTIRMPEAPDTSWVYTLESLADCATPQLEFKLKDYKALIPPPQSSSLRKVPDPQLNCSQLEAVRSTWRLLAHALALCGVPDPGFNAFASNFKERKHTQRERDAQATPDANPLRVHNALTRWSLALWRVLPAADDFIPAIADTLEWLSEEDPRLGDALRWSADVGQWAGNPVSQRPDGIWCTCKGVPLKLKGLKILPSQVAPSN